MKVIYTEHDLGRFFQKVIFGKNKEDCWEFYSWKCKWGYGRFHTQPGYYRKVTLKPHRFSYLIHKGTIPNNLLVRHKCDNPGCVNPDHLELGNEKDNHQDMVSRSRDKNSPAYKNRHATHCKNGHEFTPENIYIRNRKGGGRSCKACIFNRQRIIRERRKTSMETSTGRD